MYRHWYLQMMVSEEDQKDRCKANLGVAALRNLRALFKDRPEFKDEDSESKFLRSSSSPDDPKILNVLLAYTRDLHGKLSRLLIKGPFHAQSAIKMRGMIKNFVQHTTNPQIDLGDDEILKCSPWPMVKLAT